MKLKNCKNCGKVFIEKNSELCDKCHQEQEMKYIRVKDYLWDNDQATIDDIHQATGISKNVIRKFVREGRFKRL
jgi:RecJ-like exonuclease